MTIWRGRTGDPAFRLVVHPAASRSVGRIGLQLMIKFAEEYSQGDGGGSEEEF